MSGINYWKSRLSQRLAGGRIDHAHHVNNAHLALSETVAFDDAVAVAKEMTGDDTLMVVTADHSHVFTIAGYPDRGHNIFGRGLIVVCLFLFLFLKLASSEVKRLVRNSDNLPFRGQFPSQMSL